MQLSPLFVLGFNSVMGVGCKAHVPEAAPEAAPEAVSAPEPSSFKDGEGELRMNSLPWAHVVIDGAPAGRTGRPVALKAGVHTVALTTSDGSTHSMKVTITSGEVLKLCWDFDKEERCER